MYRNRICLALLMGLFLSTNAGADSFNPESNQLSISSVTVGNQVYSDVVIQLDKYTVVSMGKAESVPVVKEICSSENITEENYDLIEKGVAIETVSQVVGCSPKRTSRFNDLMVYTYGSYKNSTGVMSVHIRKEDGVYSKNLLVSGTFLIEPFID